MSDPDPDPEPEFDPTLDPTFDPNTCGWCQEPILPSERISPYSNLHRECAFRAVMGSLAHQQRLCSHYVPGSTAADPPGLSPREAARKSMEYYVLQHRRN